MVVRPYWLKRASIEEFEAAYDPVTWPSHTDSTGLPLVAEAMSNQDPATRAFFVGRLLDDGADATVVLDEGYTLLHVLLAQRARDPEVDPPLVRRLIAAGADVNRPAGRHQRRPVEEVDHPKLSAEELEPYYRAFFDQPGLELLAPSPHGRSVLGRARSSRFRRPQLFDLVTAYLDAAGLAPTDEALTRTATWQTLDEIRAVYTPALASATDENGDSLLHAVLRNPDLAVRSTLVPQLLADGADVTLRTAEGDSVLHLALDRSGAREADQDARVLRALISAGADVNASSPANGVPLTALAAQGNFPEGRLEPLYDVLLAAPGLDPAVPLADGRTALDVVRTARPARPVLVARLEAMVV
jgi:hypothetical protein